MKALINYKICDNAPECSGIAVCPVKAMYYDEQQKQVVVADSCTNCGLCEKECPVGAILCSQNATEYSANQELIANDKRTIKDLFVDRYGAVPLSEFFMINEADLEQRLTTDLTLIELYDNDTLSCLLKSIPIKEITDQLTGDIKYYNFEPSPAFQKQYAIKELPTLLIYKNKKLLGKVEGYFTIEQQTEFIAQIKAIIDNN